MSILEGIWAIEKWVVLAKELKKCIFVKALLYKIEVGEKEASDLHFLAFTYSLAL